MSQPTNIGVKVADEVWLITALLHRENPKREDFTVHEIVERATKESIQDEIRPGVYLHALQHCVANREPQSGRYRMLYETGKKTRRLFRPGDSYHPAREGAKMLPNREDVPERYRDLIDWYNKKFKNAAKRSADDDPLLALRGMWKGLWKDEKPDDYVRRLREDWE
jgi:hypothetical protein